MAAIDVLLIALSVTISFSYLTLIRSFDKYEKEPWNKILIAALAGGFIAVAISVTAYDNLEVGFSFTDVVLKTGFIDELSILSAFMIIYYLIRKEFNEPTDGIIYISAISIVFSCYYNILYALISDNPFLELISRSFFSVAGIVVFSGFTGIAFYIHKTVHINYRGLLISVVVASTVHGMIDYLQLFEGFPIILIILYIFLILIQIWVYRLTYAFSIFRPELSMDMFKTTGRIVPMFCNNCKTIMETKEVRFRRLIGGLCFRCQSLIMDFHNLMGLLRYFVPIKGDLDFVEQLSEDFSVTYLDEKKKIVYNSEKKCLSASPLHLGTWIRDKNLKMLQSVLTIPFMGFYIKQIGLNYLLTPVQEKSDKQNNKFKSIFNNKIENYKNN